ncbi:hypothetical protein LCGC14_1177360 [marine sediment metagenome]|uniref:Uncharacterized protein n=1 Tax=marine sediment metagenome TaxID=412755 RepID=A0A0F9MAW2_9ZZZZ
MSDKGMTHSAECYRWHHGCATAMVERLQARFQQLETLVSITRDNIKGGYWEDWLLLPNQQYATMSEACEALVPVPSGEGKEATT